MKRLNPEPLPSVERLLRACAKTGAHLTVRDGVLFTSFPIGSEWLQGAVADQADAVRLELLARGA